MAHVGFLLFTSLASGADPASSLLSADDMRFLEEMTSAVVEASRVRPGEKVGDIGPNTTGGTVIRPGGRGCYPAFWIRDYAMSLESGLVTLDEQRHMLLLTADNQRDERWSLPSGSVVTPGSIADHITFGGRPIYFPGTLEDYEGQGGPNWGKLPCLDDAFFFIHMAFEYVAGGGDIALLSSSIRNTMLMQRLDAAFDMPPARPDSGLVFADEGDRGITFGFVDTITHTGDLLFCSLLKYRGAVEVVSLAERLKDAATATRYGRTAERLRRAVQETFVAPSGFLRASTGKSAQPDVWGTAFAVYIGVLEAHQERKACEALAAAYRNGSIAWRGNIRHVPTADDFSPSTAWELSLGPKNQYQNGAYWGTPTGWVAYAIAKVDRETASQLAREYIDELREGDFRKGDDFGSPWECMHPEGRHRQNPVYMTSVTCPLAAFRRLANEEKAAAPGS